MSRSRSGRRRLTLVLSGAVVALSLAIVDRMGQTPDLQAVEVTPLPIPPGEKLEPFPDKELPPLESLRQSLSRPLFRESRRAPEPEAVALEPVKAEPLDYDLVGISLFDGRRVALVRQRRGGRVLRVAEGGSLGQWRVTAIAAKHLELRSVGTVEELRLKDTKRRVIRTNARLSPEAEPAPEPDDSGQDPAEGAVQ